MTSGKVRFVERKSCPACGISQFRPVWSGKFSDTVIMAFMRSFHYSIDIETVLDGQPFALVECVECGFRYHRVVVAEEWIPIVYGTWIDAQQVANFEAEHGHQTGDRFVDNLQAVRLLMRLRHLAIRGGFHSNDISLLDFGCGDGHLLNVAAALGLQAFGVDISRSRTERATASGALVFPDLETFDTETSGVAHIVVLNQVLEHVMSPRGLLEALRERIPLGGVLFVAVPDCSGISSPNNFAEFHCLQPIEHVNAFSPRSLRELAQSVGFSPLRRPAAFATTRFFEAARSAAGAFIQRDSTEQFFRLARKI